MKKIKIAFIIPCLSGGGAERATAVLAGAIDKEKFEVCLILEKDAATIYEVPGDLRVAKLSVSKTRKALLPLIRLMRDWKPDIVYSALPHLNVLAVVAATFCSHKVRTIVSVHNNQKYELATVPAGRILKFLMPIIYKLCTAVVVVSEGIKVELAEAGVEKAKLNVVYNPIDIKRIVELSNETIQHDWFDKKYSVVISMGRLVPQKNFKLLLRSFANVYKINPTSRLIIIGDGEQLDELIELRDELNLDKVVDFVGGLKNPFSWLRKAKCFVLTSEYEGFGMVLVEAMVVGLPVVSVDCQYGPAEILENGLIGKLVKECSSSEITAAIDEVLNNADVAKKLSDAGLKRACDFDLVHPVRKLEELIARLH